jgi:hypothetical protein
LSRAARRDHRHALGVIHCHRLFDIHRLACRRAAQDIIVMGIGQSRDVDRVDVRRLDDCVGIIVPTRHAVASREVRRELPVASHDRD